MIVAAVVVALLHRLHLVGTSATTTNNVPSCIHRYSGQSFPRALQTAATLVGFGSALELLELIRFYSGLGTTSSLVLGFQRGVLSLEASLPAGVHWPLATNSFLLRLRCLWATADRTHSQAKDAFLFYESVACRLTHRPVDSQRTDRRRNKTAYRIPLINTGTTVVCP